MDDLVLTVHLVAACIMVGVIWFVQLVHYPLLAVVPVESAKQVAEKHQRWTGIVVGPPMAVEGVTTLILWANTPSGVSWWLTWVNGACLAVALLCTIFYRYRVTLAWLRHLMRRLDVNSCKQIGLAQSHGPCVVFLAAVMLLQGM